MIKNIVVTPYNPKWPATFASESKTIQHALEDNCIELHHVGSTSVPELSAKPIIDIICVVKDTKKAIEPLERLSFKYKGEYNIPMRLFFSRSEGVLVNLHVYEADHPEIELNLLFRDYLRNNRDAREEYANLKNELLKDKASFEKKDSKFTGYNLGKDAFIRKVLKATNFNRVRMVKCMHYAEWETAKKLRNSCFVNGDSDTWTFDHKDHAHLILYQGVDAIGYAHIHLNLEGSAVIKLLVIDEPFKDKGYDTQFLELCHKWFKMHG